MHKGRESQVMKYLKSAAQQRIIIYHYLKIFRRNPLVEAAIL